nr:MAG TPA: Flagellar and Swarming motility protein [Caudoviricetes sp.]
MIEVCDERDGNVLINVEKIRFIEEERYGCMTYIVLDGDRTFKVFESYEDVKSKIKQVRLLDE